MFKITVIKDETNKRPYMLQVTYSGKLGVFDDIMTTAKNLNENLLYTAPLLRERWVIEYGKIFENRTTIIGERYRLHDILSGVEQMTEVTEDMATTTQKQVEYILNDIYKKSNRKVRELTMKTKKELISDKKNLLFEIDRIDEQLEAIGHQEKPFIAAISSYHGRGTSAFKTEAQARRKLYEYSQMTYYNRGLSYGAYMYKYLEDGTKQLLEVVPMNDKDYQPHEFKKTTESEMGV